MKHIAVIDCAIEEPAIHCYNRLVERINTPISYHSPHFAGISSIETCKEAQAYIIFGSETHVYQNLKWANDLSEVILQKLEKHIPVLGICFGHQLMAHKFGSIIGYIKDDKEFKFEGVRQFKILKSLCGLKVGEAIDISITHHQEVKSIPDCLERIGASDDCTFDFLAHKSLPYIGVQGHPEASYFFFKDSMDQLPPEEDIKKAQIGGDKIIDNFLNQFIF